MSRHAGLLIPLFSAVSSSSWAIGELTDIGPLAAWLSAGGFDRLMLLPIGTMAGGQSSPYSAVSAMAIDPIYLTIDAIEDFSRAGGVTALSTQAQQLLAEARSSPRIRHELVRQAKREALDLASTRFIEEEWGQFTPRGAALAAYIARERGWLDDYALFQVLSERMPGGSWREWPAALRDREPRALDEARRQLSRDVLRQQYLQWCAETQWQEARAAAARQGVVVVGDLPFVVQAESADVWARADQFLLDVSVGTPPDAFSATGQDWGLPAYRWEAMDASNFSWLRQRARRMAALFDGFRVDHVVGFYRTYGRPADGDPFFTPADEGAQLALGEHLMRIFLASGAAVVAEDLGTVPDFVRASLARLGVPGYRVLRWERHWHADGRPFVDPVAYPSLSVATTGTHDTETLAEWWDGADPEERSALQELPFLRERGFVDPSQAWTDAWRDGLLELMYRSGSDDLFLPVQDLFGWRDRINTPATVNELNWTWRLPWPVDRLADMPEAAERAAFSRRLAERARRTIRSL